ncbi:MAG: hypothetical protein RL518_1058 [Pseudomonadota bacterium]
MEAQPISSSQTPIIERFREPSHILSSRVENLSPDLFLTGAALSVGLSLFLRVTGRQHDAQFVGQWAPTLLLLGLYTRGGRSIGTFSTPPSPTQDVGGREMH